MVNSNFTPWLGDGATSVQDNYITDAFNDGDPIYAYRFNAALRMSSLVAAAIVESQDIKGNIGQSLTDIANQLKAQFTSNQINTNKLQVNSFTKSGFEDADIRNDTAIFLLPRLAYSTTSVEDGKFIQTDDKIYFAQVLSYIYQNYIVPDHTWQTAIFVGSMNPNNLQLMLLYIYPYAGTPVTIQGDSGRTLESVILPAYSTGLVLNYSGSNIRTFGTESTISGDNITNTQYFYYPGIKVNTLQPGNATADIGSTVNKFNNIYANNFNGNATSATKATQDADGNNINTTYLTKTGADNTYYKKTDTVTNATHAVTAVSANSADTSTTSTKIKISNIDYTLKLSGTTLTFEAG